MGTPVRIGSCLCGGVRYEVRGELKAFARCHCVQCRKASGAEFSTNASVAVQDFRFLAGENLIASYESSPGNLRQFCGRCGSPLVKRVASKPQEVRLRLGCIDSDLEERPLLHVFVAQKPNWSEIADALPQFSTVPELRARR
jgi:hypothetical protein